MAITYNNLYMDIRQKLHRAGIDAATLEARELVAFAAGKNRQELLRDGGLYVSQEVEQRAAALEAQNDELVEAMAAMVEDVYSQDLAAIEEG